MITFPLSLPTKPGFSRVKITETTTVGMSQSPFSGSQQVYQWPREFWSADCTLPSMYRAYAEVWASFLSALRGQAGTFLLGDPAATAPQGVATGIPLVNGASQTGTTLVTKGWTPSTTNILLAGDYIQLGPSTAVPSQRLYKNLTNASTDASGNATLDIFPRLRESPADGDVITLANTVGTFRLAKNNIEWDIDAAKIYSISFQAIEAF